MRKRSVRRKAKKIAAKVVIPATAIILVFLFILLYTPGHLQFTAMASRGFNEKTPALYEITETDIFSLQDFHAKDISVKGVVLGDTPEQVKKKLGEPDNQFQSVRNRINYEYGKSIGLEDTGLIIQFRYGRVAKMTLKKSFNTFLKGKTKITHTKEEIYSIFGKPDETLFLPLKQGSTIAIRVLQYQAKGIEVIIRSGNENGFALTKVFDSN